MAVTMRRLVLVYWCFISWVNGIEIKTLGIGECLTQVDGIATLEYQFNEDANSVDVTFDNPVDIEEDDLVKFSLHKYFQGDWDYNVQEQNGSVCDYIHQFLDGAWTRLQTSADVDIADECFLGKGKYKWTNLVFATEDVMVPSGFIGRYKIDVNLIKEDDTLFCLAMDAEISD